MFPEWDPKKHGGSSLCSNVHSQAAYFALPYRCNLVSSAGDANKFTRKRRKAIGDGIVERR